MIKIFKDEKGKEHYVREEAGRAGKVYYFRIPHKWWDSELAGLNCVERCLLVDLRSYANLEGFCWPSLRRLCDKLRISRNYAGKCLKNLEKRKFLKIVKSKKGYWNKWTYYLL